MAADKASAGASAAARWRRRRFAGHETASMALEMKTACERCGAALAAEGAARICSYECSFCTACAGAMAHICPNCGGELVPRPRRRTPG